MNINGIVETAIHVDDVPRSAEFYERLFKLPASPATIVSAHLRYPEMLYS